MLEHRTENTAKISFVLVPPTLRDSGHRFNTLREQAVLLTKDPSKYNQTFITLLSFNKERLQLDDLQAGFEKVAEEIEYLKHHGAPSNPAYYNNVSDWRKLFALLKPPQITVAPTPKPSPLTDLPQVHETRFPRVLWLGAEFNSSKGDRRSMDEIAHVALRGGLRCQDTYFQIFESTSP